MRSLSSAVRNMRRTPYQTIASLLVMVLTFFLLLLFLVASYGSNRVLQHFESLPKVSAYFKAETTDIQVQELKQKLEQTGKVAQVRTISKEEALKIYTERFKDKPQLTEFVQKDFFPMSIDIKANRPQDLDEIATVLKSNENVEEVTFLKDDIKALLNWTNTVRLFGFALTAYAVVTSIFTILIVIGMKIASKKEEIEILQLLGATRWYIRMPFLVEGILYGVIGAVIAFLVGVGPFLYVQEPLARFFSSENFSVFPPAYIFLSAVLAIQVGIGIVIGAIGSFIALVRYLRN